MRGPNGASGSTPPAFSRVELLRAKEAAEAANEAKTRYLVSVSHEIRSPLNAIYGYAQLLESGGAVSSAEAGAVIRRSAEHLTNLVESLLEVSRIESGVIKIRSDIVEIRTFLDQLFDMFRVQASAKGLSLEFDISDRLPAQVRTDEKRLRQILINLLSNALQYTDTGRVTVTINYRSQVADIEVSDTGIGIAEADLERVFEPFERGTSAEAQRQPGIGLGLAITRALALMMGGDLAVRSKLGTGSIFRLRLLLPAPMTPLDKAPPDDRIAGCNGDPRTVLVIDDDPAQIAIVQSLLRPLGFVVHAAANGVEGIALATRCSPDLILMDGVMPRLDGFEATRRIKAMPAFTQIPIIFMTGLAEGEDVVRGLSAGAIDYVTKPIVIGELLARIRGHLATARVAQGSQSALDTSGRPALAVDGEARLLWLTPMAGEILEKSFHGWSPTSGALPDRLLSSIRGLQAAAPHSGARVTIDLDDGVLEAEFLRRADANQWLFLLSQNRGGEDQRLLAARHGLTSREAEVLLWISRGKQNREVSEILKISPRTVNKHLEQIFEKMGIGNRASATAIAVATLTRA